MATITRLGTSLVTIIVLSGGSAFSHTTMMLLSCSPAYGHQEDSPGMLSPVCATKTNDDVGDAFWGVAAEVES